MKKLSLTTLLLFIAWVASSKMVAFQWNASASVTGYKLYYGTESQNYTRVVDVGNGLSTSLELEVGQTYYIAATAYDAGNESDFSNEVTLTVLATNHPDVNLGIINQPGAGFTLNFPAFGGHRYKIQASEDLTVWTTIKILTTATDGPQAFTDPESLNQPKRFYRLVIE